MFIILYYFLNVKMLTQKEKSQTAYNSRIHSFFIRCSALFHRLLSFITEGLNPSKDKRFAFRWFLQAFLDIDLFSINLLSIFFKFHSSLKKIREPELLFIALRTLYLLHLLITYIISYILKKVNSFEKYIYFTLLQNDDE